MAIQDLLTVAFESTFIASVVFFSVQFGFFVASNQTPRYRRRYRYVPTPIATVTTRLARSRYSPAR